MFQILFVCRTHFVKPIFTRGEIMSAICKKEFEEEKNKFRSYSEKALLLKIFRKSWCLGLILRYMANFVYGPQNNHYFQSPLIIVINCHTPKRKWSISLQIPCSRVFQKIKGFKKVASQVWKWVGFGHLKKKKIIRKKFAGPHFFIQKHGQCPQAI